MILKCVVSFELDNTRAYHQIRKKYIFYQLKISGLAE